MSNRQPTKRPQPIVQAAAKIAERAGGPSPQILSTTTTTTEVVRHSGPIPSPQDLAAYDKIVPGLAERIVAMAERQQVHRHGIEAKDINEGVSYAKRGQWMAYSLAITLVGIATFLATAGHERLAGGIFLVLVVVLSATFLMSRREDKSAVAVAAGKALKQHGK